MMRPLTWIFLAAGLGLAACADTPDSVGFEEFGVDPEFVEDDSLGYDDDLDGDNDPLDFVDEDGPELEGISGIDGIVPGDS